MFGLCICFHFILRCFFNPFGISYLINTDLKIHKTLSFCISSTCQCVLLLSGYLKLNTACVCRHWLLAVCGSAAASGLYPVVCRGIKPEGNQIHCHLPVQGSPLRFQSPDVHRQDIKQTITIDWPGPAPGQRYWGCTRLWVTVLVQYSF